MIMDSRFLASGLLLLVLLLEPADSGLQPTAANVDAQQAARSPETYVPIDATVYSKLLDAIFPVDIAPSHRVFLIVLRRTGFGPESQVVIRMESDYSVDARWYRVTNGVAHTIASRYKQQTGHEDIRRMASMIKVEERRIAVPRSQAEEWQSTLLEALEDSAAGLKHAVEEDRKDGSERIVLDGTFYELWYVQGTISTHWSLVDINPDNPDELPVLRLSRWMNVIMDAGGGKGRR